MTRRIAGLDQGDWDHDAEQFVRATFDALAGDWHTRTSPERTAVVDDALARGLDRLTSRTALAVEVGSGIGTYSPLLARRFDVVVSVELSWEMLTRADDSTHRVQGDGGRLPLRDRSADAVALINAFLFPVELDRVLAPSGVVLWVNSSGEDTPIYLSFEDVEAALPFPVVGVASRAGSGTWCALARRLPA
ncbi:MAG TPA: class I SAM-dependent methyltransferase [Acidimicrobiia bacterium]|nr:class I SAM-dependent methyltransferase [Acidimicrobiia bacterium]